MELGSHTKLERDGAGLSYRIGGRWSWASSRTELERGGARLSLIQNWKEMELGSHRELDHPLLQVSTVAFRTLSL